LPPGLFLSSGALSELSLFLQPSSAKPLALIKQPRAKVRKFAQLICHVAFALRGGRFCGTFRASLLSSTWPPVFHLPGGHFFALIRLLWNPGFVPDTDGAVDTVLELFLARVYVSPPPWAAAEAA
jgi:hypothetical protein